MSPYEAEVLKARAACLALFHAKTAVETRRSALARAWHLRPGGHEWADLLADVNAELPPAAWLGYATARNDERLGRAG